VEVGASVNFQVGIVGGVFTGLLARYVDASNHLRVYLQSSAITGRQYLVFAKVVGGTLTVLVRRKVTPPSGWIDLRLLVFTSGSFIAEMLANGASITQAIGNDSALATGGALATGNVGVIDHNGTPTAWVRQLDNFYASSVANEPVVIFPNQMLEVRHDGNQRRNSDGQTWGVPPASRGSRLLLPPAGDGRLDTQVVYKVRRNDIEASDNPVVDDQVNGVVLYTPRYLAPRA
jgi:hypothetical protein